jgi:hypothetical protein
MVWRSTDGTDALYADCVGPSGYSKAAGKPVTVWGLRANGKMELTVLHKGDAVDNDLYSELIDEKFSDSLGGCEHSAQDFEACLWSDDRRCTGGVQASRCGAGG